MSLRRCCCVFAMKKVRAKNARKQDSLIVDSSDDVYVHTRKKKGTVRDSSDISGLSKLRFDSSWQAVEDIISLSLDDDEVCVIESPPVEDDRGIDDY